MLRTVCLRVLALMALILAAPDAWAQEVVGKVARLQGSAQAGFADAARVLSVGAPIRNGDILSTGDDTRLQVEFLDGSSIILGDLGRLVVIDVALPAQGKGGAQAIAFQQGSFRFTSGAIAQADRESVRLTSPVASIAIRGTDFFGGPLQSGMPAGQLHYGFMRMGGAIDVITPQGTVTLSKPSEGTFLPMSGGKAPTPPAIWSQEAITEAYDAIGFK